MYNVVALIGEAGSGKDTLMQRILARKPGYFNEIISCTTRPMREGEAEGVNYFYFTAKVAKTDCQSFILKLTTIHFLMTNSQFLK